MNTFEYNFLGLNKFYGKKAVIHDVRIKLCNAQCTLLIGENGAGKTTLLKIVSGLKRPDSGMIRINNETYKWGQCKSRLLKNIMYLHQQPFMFEGTVKTNLQYLLKVSKQPMHLIDDAIEWAGIRDITQQNAKSLSGGEKQRVALARAFLRNPEVILLDEPTANLDRTSKIRTLDLLKQFKNRGIAMIIASHDPDIFQDIQDERLQLDSGKLTNLKPRNKSNRVQANQVQANGVTHINKFKAKSA